jgi:hypothetical protein
VLVAAPQGSQASTHLATVRELAVEVFYGTQYDPMVVRSYYRFFSMGTMIML